MFVFIAQILFAQKVTTTQQFTSIDPGPFSDNTNHWYSIYDKSNMINAMPGRPHYESTQITNIADNLLLFQKDNGGWPKNYDFFAILTDKQKDTIRAAKNRINTTFDNGNTYTQIAALAIAFTATRIEKYKLAALKGLDFILAAQYNNGGWPQYFPLEQKYSRLITYNDGVIKGIMELLKDISDGKPQYAFIDNKYREKLKVAFDKGMDCIIKTQIIDNGKPTAWCQQHDEVTLKPAWARKFEPASICNKESAELVLFLMSIDHPKKEIINAIQNAVVWFQESKIYNTVVKRVAAPKTNTPFKVSISDKIVVADSTAPPIWTRFYELKTHRPLFCNRDSKVVYSFAEVERERRDGYAWYVYTPQEVLDKYPQWQKKWAPENDVLKKK
jgi:PelA/Pel-15E family pectate lyase